MMISAEEAIQIAKVVGREGEGRAARLGCTAFRKPGEIRGEDGSLVAHQSEMMSRERAMRRQY